MCKFKFILIGLTFTFFIFACNNSSSTASSEDTTRKASADTSAKHRADSAKMIAPLPVVPKGAKVYFKNLKNGSVVHSPFEVVMEVKDMKVEAAGTVVPGAGHHHLLIDAGDSVATGEVIPKDDHHLHFGDGQTKTKVTLPPGEHRLTLQFADGIHRSYGQKLAATIKIVVK